MGAAGKGTRAAATLMLSLIFAATALEAAAAEDDGGVAMVPKGCQTKCGNVTISYPFGIGPNKHCYLNEWFLINCTKSSSDGVEKPYLSSFSGGNDAGGVGEILEITLLSITIKETVSSSCSQKTNNNISSSSAAIIPNTKLSKSPFVYATSYFSSSYSNKFVFFGCGNALLTLPDGTKLGGCTSLCDGGGGQLVGNVCYGINCCQLSFVDDSNVRTYEVNFTTNINRSACNHAFFVEQDWMIPKDFRPPEEMVVPVVWSWSLTTKDYLPPSSSECSQITRNRSNGEYYFNCFCPDSKRGNPYFENGCQGGHKLTVKELSTIIGISASFGLVLLLSGCYMLRKAIKKRKMKKLREKFFKRNGGLLLQQQLLAKEGTIEKSKICRASELDKATDHFNANRILGRGGQGTVYKGMLVDGQIVAIKKSQVVDENQVEPFINEVVILSQINHRNVVKLLGCCLETEVPILVYEFIPNGTLFSLIHNNSDDELIPLSWDIRLRIASEVAGALAYLHSATSIPIYHRDIKSSNILLDEKFRAKVSDFGTSRSISIDQTHLTTLVKGTFGYLDPEYFQSSQFTEKSDVYSFGVVLAELLTGQKPISFHVNDDEDRSLVSRFLLCMEENRFAEIVDVRISEQAKKEDVLAVAWLAQRCLNYNGKKRPTMREVAMELEAIRASRFHLLSAMETMEIESDLIS